MVVEWQGILVASYPVEPHEQAKWTIKLDLHW